MIEQIAVWLVKFHLDFLQKRLCIMNINRVTFSLQIYKRSPRMSVQQQNVLFNVLVTSCGINCLVSFHSSSIQTSVSVWSVKMHEMTKCKCPGLYAGMCVIQCCVCCWIWGLCEVWSNLFFTMVHLCNMGYQWVSLLMDWTFRPWQIASACAGHPDIIANKPPHAVFIDYMTLYFV